MKHKLTENTVSIFKRVINRREFLQKMGSLVLAMPISQPYLKDLISTDAVNAAGQCTAYGSGPYGQGSYCGSLFRICLPIVSKKGN